MTQVNTIEKSIDRSNAEIWSRVRTYPKESLDKAMENLAQSEALNYDLGIARSNGVIGTAYTWMSEYEKALDYSFKAAEQLNTCRDYKYEAEIYYTISVVFYFLGEYSKQRKYAKKNFDISEKSGDIGGMASALNGIGTAYYSENKFEEAIKVLMEASEKAIEAGNKEVLGRIYDGLGQSYLGINNYDEALNFKYKSLDVSTELGSKQVQSFANEGIGQILHKLERYEEALSHYYEALRLREETDFKLGIAYTKLRIGDTLAASGNPLKSVAFYKDVVTLGEKLKSNELLFKAHYGLASIYDTPQTLQEFVTHYKKYHQFKEEFQAENESKRIKAFELKGKLEQVQKEKDDLEEKNKKLEKFFDDVKVLSTIGQEITSTLDLESIFNIIYERINSLMKAEGIFVAVCNYEKNSLDVPLAIDDGKRDKFFSYSLNDSHKHLPVYSVKYDENIHINNYSEEITNFLEAEEEFVNGQPESLVLIPLKVKDLVIGVLLVQSRGKYAFNSHHFNILKSFASYISIALDNAFLYQNMENKVQERTEEIEKFYQNTELLTKIGQQLISTLDFESVFELLYKNVNELMDATVFGVRLLDESKKNVIYKYEYERGHRLGDIVVPMSNLNNYSVWCILHNKEILINNNEVEYSKYVDEVMVVDGDFPYSLIFYPLRNGDEVLGAISVQSFEKNAYNNYHLNIVKTLAQYTTIALENARSYEVMEEKVKHRTSEIRKTYENQKLLSEIGKDITSQLSVEKIIEVVYSNINQLMDAEGFGIGIFDPVSKELSFPGYIESGKKLDGGHYTLDEENRLAVVCFNHDRDIIINDLENEYGNFIDSYVKPKVGKAVTSLIYLPIYAKDEKIGVITVQSFDKHCYTNYHVDVLRSIAIYTGIALDNASLYENMEENVRIRTEEVVKQKETIEQSFATIKLISQINKDISESITIGSIIDSVYENVNSIMDATGFGIGVYNQQEEVIKMLGYIEKGDKLDDFEYDIHDEERLATWCFRQQKEIFISNYPEEYQNYISGMQQPVSGKDSSSIIYLPLYSKDKIVGLLTVQSFEKEVYTEYHMDILRGLAATIGSAVENALLYENLENKVKERTAEVVKQKEQIEKASENTRRLSEIGKEIAAELSSADIISKVYTSINQMMDATIFGIGVYRQELNDLYFSGAFEKGEKLDDFHYSVDVDKIATTCFREEEEIVINNWSEEYIKHVPENYSATQGEMPESLIYLPLISKGNKIGVLTVQSLEKNSYDEYHVNVLRTLSLYIASALENASLYQSLEKRVEERTREIQKAYDDTKLLSKISKDIVETLEVEKIISNVYKNINTLLDATCFGIGIYEESSNNLVFPGFIENNQELDDLSFSLDGDYLAAKCYLSNEEIIIADYNLEYQQFLNEDLTPVSGDYTYSVIYLPLKVKDKTIGVMTVQSYDKHAYSDYQIDILRSIATTVATALDNAMLYANMEEKVKERTLELLRQNTIIEEKNKHITDSIRYAKRIQDATLPDRSLVETYLKEAFVLFKPKDIVSGDFYWVERVENKILFAVVDCTGHGVPGAFLSLIGHNSLNQIVNELGIIQPAEILNNLNKILHNTLKSGVTADSTTIRDGMDLTICSLDTTNNILEFAGANNPIYLVQNSELKEIKGDKVAIGADLGKQNFSYTNHTLHLNAGDTIYLFSDGYADQFGGPRGKKLKYSAFKEILMEIQHENMLIQRDILDSKILEWQGDLEQIDDVCIMGVKL